MSKRRTCPPCLWHLLVVIFSTATFHSAGDAAAKSPRVEPGRSAASQPSPLGYWQSVDFVERIDDFQPGQRKWQGDLFLKEFQFFKGGKTSLDWTWTQDWITHANGRTRYQYSIKNADGTAYLFLPWLSGDVTERGQQPHYYVLKKSASLPRKPSGRSEMGLPPSTGGQSFTTVRPITSVKEYGDVRYKDMSGLNLAGLPGLPVTLTFNEGTVWPERAGMPAGFDPKKLLVDAMNPGLGIRKLHAQGITGQGVNVAIIDQPLYQDHPEFAGKFVAYHDVGCKSESSMHGPAVAGLLVGKNCGTAPAAKLYYVAAPSWTGDAAYYAKALDWLGEQNTKLPAGQKIRVVSVSAAPSGPASPFKMNNEMWDGACARAEAAGILVLDCTEHRGFISRCFLDLADPENPLKCRPCDGVVSGHLLVPCSPRTTAEEYNKGQCTYQYWGRGGLSWSIPYCAGVLALGWQVRPDLTASQMRAILFQSAAVTPDGAHIINPGQFIRMVKASRASGKPDNNRPEH